MEKRDREEKNVFVIAMLMVLLFASGPADRSEAATLTVTKTADTADGACDSDCSLREAIIAANSASDHDVIVVPAGIYTLTIGGALEDNAASGDLDITEALTINGEGQGVTIIEGGVSDRILDVAPGEFGIVVELNDLTIRNGIVPDAGLQPVQQGGGGLRNSTILTLTHVAVSGNIASFGVGGGIQNDGDLTLLSSQVSENDGIGGGGIFNAGYITLVGSRVVQNNSRYAVISGGGVSNSGDAMLIYSTVAGNSAGTGGGIENSASSHLIIRNSTVSGNLARSYNGGGIENKGIAELVNCTISGNTAYRGGGIANFSGTTVLANVTLADNVALAGVPEAVWTGKGGGLYSYAGQIGLKNSLLANNTAADVANNCLLESGATLADSGYNIDDGNSCGLSGTGDLINTDPVIGLLADNGGPSQTIALPQGSPAIDAGNPGGCNDSDDATLVTDQRGLTRSVDGDSDGSSRCDIGAYEYGAVASPGADLAVVQTDAPDPVMVGQVLTYTVTITNHGPAPTTGVLMTSTLDGGVMIYPPYPSQGSCTVVGQSVRCRLWALGSGESATVEVYAVPTAAGEITNLAQIWDYEFDQSATNNTAAEVTTVQAAPQIAVIDSVPPVSDLQLPFGDVTKGNASYQTVTVTNYGSADLVVGYMAQTNPLDAPFSISIDNCSGQRLVPSGSCTIEIQFLPTSVGFFSDTFDIPSNDPDENPVTVSVSGTGLIPSVTIAATDPDAGEPSSTGTFAVSRTGSTASSLMVYYSVGGSATPGSDYNTLSGSVMIGAGSLTATITVTPIDDGQVEGSETVIASLSANANYTVGYPDGATVNIADNDSYTAMTLLSPNGGEVIPAGNPYNVQWGAPGTATKFKLKYSLDNGVTWMAIAPGFLTGTSYPWQVPIFTNNKRKCLVKVIGFNDNSQKIGVDKSNGSFSIEVVRLTSPNGAEALTSGDQHNITWKTNGLEPGAKVVLSYTLNNGLTWKTINTTTDPWNDGNFLWTLPNVTSTKTKCKVKVVLKDALGNKAGSDKSDSFFTINPAP